MGSMSAATETPAADRPSLAWRDRGLAWVLLLALATQAYSWAAQRGYALADAVEFMDRAQTWVGGDELRDVRTVRSFAYSALFVGPFALARALGLDDPRPLLAVARLLQVAIALGLVAACGRLAARAAGRSAGLAVAFVVAIHPLVLQFGVQPVSGLAAAMFIALGLERLIQPGGRRDGFLGGIGFGLAFLMAYQSLLIALAVGVVLLVRDRWKGRASWLGLIAGMALCAAVQLSLDRAVYGTWQASLWRYLLENVGFVFVHLLVDFGQRELASDVYQQITLMNGGPSVHDVSAPTMMRFGTWWYLEHAHRFLVVPVLALLLLGTLRSVLRPRWSGILAIVATALTLWILSRKGDKSLRLMLPLLPLCVVLIAIGWQWLAQAARGRAVATLLCVATLPFAYVVFQGLGLRNHAAYWDAARWVQTQHEERVARAGEVRTRVAAAYDWAVFLRFGSGVDKVKLAGTLDRFDKFPPEEQTKIVERLDGLDWLVLHEPLLNSQPALTAEIARRFRVAAAFYDQDEAPLLGAVLVLARADSGGARLIEFGAPARPPRHLREISFAGPGDVASGDAQAERLALLGFDLEPLAGDGWWWITYHWRLAGPPDPIEVRDRVSAPDERNTWQNDHRLARGVAAPPDANQLREGFLFVPSAVDLDVDARFRPLGGPYRRGERIPIRLWMEVRDRVREAPLAASRSGASRTLAAEVAAESPPDWRWSVGGAHVSKDGLVEFGSLFLPVHRRAFARDDGKPIPD